MQHVYYPHYINIHTCTHTDKKAKSMCQKVNTGFFHTVRFKEFLFSSLSIFKDFRRFIQWGCIIFVTESLICITRANCSRELGNKNASESTSNRSHKQYSGFVCLFLRELFNSIGKFWGDVGWGAIWNLIPQWVRICPQISDLRLDEILEKRRLEKRGENKKVFRACKGKTH